MAAFGMRESTTELAPKTAPAGQDTATFAGAYFRMQNSNIAERPAEEHTDSVRQVLLCRLETPCF